MYGFVTKNPTAKANLDIVGTATVAATYEKFVTRDKFVVDDSGYAKVKISYLSELFIDWFIDKTEEPIQGSNIIAHDISRASFDPLIISELGGEAKAETLLTELFWLIERQGHGEKGLLCTTNTKANVFYVRDIKGVLRAASCRWVCDTSWQLHACSVVRKCEWSVGHRVFSRI